MFRYIYMYIDCISIYESYSLNSFGGDYIGGYDRASIAHIHWEKEGSRV